MIWKTIDTAPNDKEIILWFPKKKLAINGIREFHDFGDGWENPGPVEYWWFTTDDLVVVEGLDDFPTHWMEYVEPESPASEDVS